MNWFLTNIKYSCAPWNDHHQLLKDYLPKYEIILDAKCTDPRVLITVGYVNTVSGKFLFSNVLIDNLLVHIFKEAYGEADIGTS